MRLYSHLFYTSRGENALEIQYCSKVIAVIDTELALLEKRFSYPERFVNTQAVFQSDLYIIPKPKGLGIIGFAEIVLAIHETEEVLGSSGKPAPANQIARIFEQAFNFEFGDIYDKQQKIIDRKPFNKTKGLDYLRNNLIRRCKRKENREDEKK